MTTPCTKEAEITEIRDKLNEVHNKMDLIYSKLMGNGNPGLLQKWYELEGSVNTWKFLVIIIGVGISALALLK